MTTRIANSTPGLSLVRANLQPLTAAVHALSAPRLDTRLRSHDPLQFAGVRALRFDRGRYRPSQIDAKLELRMTGDSTSVGLGGAVSRLLRQVAK
ncbi:hypothetical protein [Sphingomonas sp. RS2018]